MKQSLIALARQTRILPILERFRFAAYWLKTRSSNAKFATKHSDFIRPPTWWMHDMYAHTDLELYRKSGAKHAAALDVLLAHHIGSDTLDVADWGCGMARVTRHLSEKHRVVGFDANKAATDWIKQNLPSIEALAHGPLPPLPVHDNSFDAVYAISVLTHLPKVDAMAWMKEINRILRKGGVFLCTVHGANQIQSLTPSERVQFESGIPIYRGNVKRGSRNYATYLPESFLRQELFIDFSVEQGPIQEFGQELWVLRKN